jgi:hypothetical protein
VLSSRSAFSTDETAPCPSFGIAELRLVVSCLTFRPPVSKKSPPASIRVQSLGTACRPRNLFRGNPPSYRNLHAAPPHPAPNSPRARSSSNHDPWHASVLLRQHGLSPLSRRLGQSRHSPRRTRRPSSTTFSRPTPSPTPNGSSPTTASPSSPAPSAS